MTTRQQTMDEIIATIIQTGFVEQKTSWQIMQEVQCVFEQEWADRNYDPRSEAL